MKMYKGNCREGIAFSTNELEVNSIINLFCFAGSVKLEKIVKHEELERDRISIGDLKSGRYLCVIHSFRKTQVQLVELTED